MKKIFFFNYNKEMQLTPLAKIKKQNLIFHQPKDYNIKNTKLAYKRLKIETQYPNNKQGPLIIESPFLFSFSFSEKRDIKSNELSGYCIPICLWEKDSKSTPEENQFYEAIKKVTDICYHYLENSFSVELAIDLKSPLFYKKIEYTDKKGKSKTKIDENSAPVLYAKLIYSEKANKICLSQLPLSVPRS